MALGQTLRFGYLEGNILGDGAHSSESVAQERGNGGGSRRGSPMPAPSSPQGSEPPGSRGEDRGVPRSQRSSPQPGSPAHLLQAIRRGTASGEERRGGSGRSSPQPEVPQPPAPASTTSLDWTFAPQREVSIQGGVVCQVSTPSVGPEAERLHKPHLVRTTRIEPSVNSVTHRPPPVPGRRLEQITVTERDLRRCGGNLRLLRECDRTPSRERPLSEGADGGAAANSGERLDLSFKSAFAQRCRSDGGLRDPWKDLKNPEDARNHNEADLIINQVWFKALSPRKIEREPGNEDAAQRTRKGNSPLFARRSCSESTRASSPDVSTASLNGWRITGSRGRRSSRRRYGEGRPASASEALPSLGIPGRSASRDCPGYDELSPGSSSSGSHGSSKSGQSKYESRIRLLAEDELADGSDLSGSGSMYMAARAQRPFERPLDDVWVEPRALWVVLDPDSGEVTAYPPAVAARMEAAHCHGRGSVPLAGLGPEYEGIIIHFGGGVKHEGPCERSLQNGRRDIRRLEVKVSPWASENLQAVVRVACGPPWRLVDDFAGVVEDEEQAPVHERHVPFGPSHAVRPPSPALPKVSDQRLYFINPGAELLL